MRRVLKRISITILNLNESRATTYEVAVMAMEEQAQVNRYKINKNYSKILKLKVRLRLRKVS